MTARINNMWVPLKGLGHQTPGHEGTFSLVLKVHLERQKPRGRSRPMRSLPPFLLEVRSQPPPATEVLKRLEDAHAPCSHRPGGARGVLDGVSTTALGGVFRWVPSALTREDNLGAVGRLG